MRRGVIAVYWFGWNGFGKEIILLVWNGSFVVYVQQGYGRWYKLKLITAWNRLPLSNRSKGFQPGCCMLFRRCVWKGKQFVETYTECKPLFVVVFLCFNISYKGVYRFTSTVEWSEAFCCRTVFCVEKDTGSGNRRGTSYGDETKHQVCFVVELSLKAKIAVSPICAVTQYLPHPHFVLPYPSMNAYDTRNTNSVPIYPTNIPLSMDRDGFVVLTEVRVMKKTHVVWFFVFFLRSLFWVVVLTAGGA